MSDNPSFEIESPDHFTAGAIGPPGQRAVVRYHDHADLKVTSELVQKVVQHFGVSMIEVA